MRATATGEPADGPRSTNADGGGASGRSADGSSGDGRGRRAASLFVITVGVFLLISYGLYAVNLIAAPAMGIEPREDPSSGTNRVVVLTRWGGLVPFPVPWWAFLIVPTALAALLIAVWRPEHWYSKLHGPVLLKIDPLMIAVVSLLAGFTTAFPTALYRDPGDPIGLYWVPAIACFVVALLGFGRRSLSGALRPRRKPADGRTGRRSAG